MRFHAKGTPFILLLYLAAVRPGLAQEREQEQEKRISTNGADRVTHKTPDRKEPPTVPRLLTPNEGLAILGAALDSRHRHSDFSSDCSHFVHGLYERAGFRYMSTRALRTFMRGPASFGESQLRNRVTWLSGADMPGSW
jgi:hypothetical protein